MGGVIMADKVLDVCGDVCPIPVLRTKNALERMKSGEVLEVIVDYTPSKENVQRYANSEGNEILEINEEDNKIKIFVKKA
jgi:tRNA 2-thiouridine synthesizing protein A